MPGITMPPVASISSVPSGGTSRPTPTAAIRSPTTSTSASVSTRWRSSMVSTVPWRRTTAVGLGQRLRSRLLLESGGRPDALSVWRQSAVSVIATCATCRVSRLDLTLPIRSGADSAVETGRLSVKRTECRGDAWTAAATPTRPAGRTAGRRLLPDPRRARTPRCCWPTSGAEVIKVEGPPGDDTRTWKPPVRDGVSTYYLGINRNKRSIVLDFGDAGRRGGRPGTGAPRRHRDRELQARRAAPLRAGLRHASRRPTPGSSTPRSAASAAASRAATPRLRPDRAGDLRPDEPDRRPGRPAVPGRDLGVRRDGRAARDHRHARRAAHRGTRPVAASTSRSTCCPRRCPGWSTTPARTSPAASCRTGWATPPEPVPLRAAALLPTAT